MVRIYAELRAEVPEHHRPHAADTFHVIDCEPAHVPEIRRRLKRQGYEIICIPI